MKFWDIALFLIIVNVFGSFFSNFAYSDLGYRGYYSLHKDQTATLEEMENQTNSGITQEEVTGSDPISNALGLLYSAVVKTFTAVFNPLKSYVLWLPYMLMMFGIPSGFAFAMGSVFWFIQIIGIVQVITGRSFRGVE